MTQQEQQLLNGLIDRVNGTQLPSKDTEAENLLNSAFQRNPDALYILCQTVLVQQFAMDNAQRQLTAARAEIDALKQGSAKPEQHGSFLGNLFGLGKSDDAPQPAPAPPAAAAYPSNQPTGYAPVRSAPVPPYGYPPQQPPPGYGYGGGYPQAGYGAPMGGGGMFGGGGGMFGSGGGFLQGAMQTAAGVVAGEFAFRAIEDVFHGFGGGGGRGFGGGSEVVNNYYDSDSSSHDGGLADRLGSADGLSGISPDIEDRRGESHGFFGGNDSSDTSSFADDSDGSSNFSDDGGESGSGFDDGGSFDSGGDDNNS